MKTLLSLGRSKIILILYSGANGSGIYGNDYGQMMAVWKLPAAVQGKTVAEMVKPGGFIARVIQAAKPR